ncbi:MAG: tetratricopeptide repeat protein, partial [Armatimonadaceae bacterium]
REAISVLEQGLRLEPMDVRGRLAFADAQLASRAPESALRTYREVQTDPRFGATAQLGAGRAALALGREQDARRFFEGARRQSPRDPAAAVAVAQMQERQNDHRGAATSYADALRLAEEGGLFSARPSLLRSLVEAQIAAGELEIALDLLESARQNQSVQSALWWRLEATIWGRKSDFANRDRALREALESETGMVPAETLRLIDREGLSEKMVATIRTELDRRERPVGPAARMVIAPSMDVAPVAAPAAPGGVSASRSEGGASASHRNETPSAAAAAAPGRLVGRRAEVPASAADRPAPKSVSTPVLLSQPKGTLSAGNDADSLRSRRAQALAALGHLYQFRGDYTSALSVRRELTVLRGNGIDWFHLAEDLERANRRVEARDAWRQAVRKGGLPESAFRYAREKLTALGG